MDVRTNPLTMAPHTQGQVISSDWDRPYTREQAAFPAVRTLHQSSKKKHLLWNIKGQAVREDSFQTA
jgi:Glycine cleavage system protein P (pyridoxal-binding), C-terminal domain